MGEFMIWVKLRVWMVFFCFLIFQLGYQLILLVLLLLIIQGIFLVVKGELVYFIQFLYVGYIFKSSGKGVDFEKIYVFGKVEIDIMKCEFYYNVEFYFYFLDEWK